MLILPKLRSSLQETKADGLHREKIMSDSFDILQVKSERSILYMIIVIGVLSAVLCLLPGIFGVEPQTVHQDDVDRILDNQSMILKLIGEVSDAKMVFISQIDLLKWVCGGVATSLAATIAVLYKHLHKVDNQLHSAHKSLLTQMSASTVARDDVWERFIDLADKNQINSLNLANAINDLRDTISKAPCGQMLRNAMEEEFHKHRTIDQEKDGNH